MYNFKLINNGVVLLFIEVIHIMVYKTLLNIQVI